MNSIEKLEKENQELTKKINTILHKIETGEIKIK